MKNVVVFGMLLFLTACTAATQYGQCIGVGDEKDPKLTYKVSTNNVVWAILGFNFIIPPVMVLADETFCPVGVKR